MSLYNENEFNRKYNAYGAFADKVRMAAGLAGIKESEVAGLVKPDVQVLLNFHITMDNGSKERFEGYFLMFSRLHAITEVVVVPDPEINLNDSKMRVALMAYQAAFWKLPAQGKALAGIICDAHKRSAGELQRLKRAFIEAFLVNNDRHLYVGSISGFRFFPGANLVSRSTESPDGNNGFYQDLANKWPGYILVQGLKRLGKEIESATLTVQGFSQTNLETLGSSYHMGVKVLAVSAEREVK